MKKNSCVLVVLICLTLPIMVVAEDLDIYGSGTVEVKPNVLIIFDNSGSMSTRDVASTSGDTTYNPATTYAGTYKSSTVYEEDKGDYDKFDEDLADSSCNYVRTALTKNGMIEDVHVQTKKGKTTCGGGGKKHDLYTGNYLNFKDSNPLRTRLEVAQEAVVNLLNATDTVDFGLMIFNSEEGGKKVADIGASKTSLITAVNGLTATTWTPLAETLAEAGLYFAGKKSLFNKSGDTFIQYTTPVDERCQKNYIILMTDGEPTRDDSLNTVKYIDDTKTVLKDEGVAGSLLDDVAAYLHTNDLLPSMGSGDAQFEDQTVITYTIGFKTKQDLLKSTASRGGGEYFTAQDSIALKNAFDSIIDSIQERNASFVAPVVPASSSNRAFIGDRIYMGVFKPKQSGRWRGNLKAYKLTAAAGLLDKNDQPATDADGMVKLTAQSLWSTVIDGYEVDKGGAGGVLINNNSRNIYTYISGNSMNLFNANNQFTVANAGLTDSLLGVSGPTLRSDLITMVRAEDSEWPLGDIVHSEPATQYHLIDTNADGVVDTTKTYIYVGANDGMLHAFDGDDGSEAWAFVPPDQLPRLQKLSNGDHDYFVDGPISLFSNGANKTLVFGERRGGSYYYALNVANPLQPVLKYKITEAHLEVLDWDNDGEMEVITTGAQLGQSWSRPQAIRLKIGDVAHDIFLLTGGYDLNQDLDTPASTDSFGRAIYGIAADTGTVTGLNVNGALWSAMTHCILDATPIDRDYNGYVNRVYAGDLGGNLLALRDDNYDGVWEQHKLFDLPATQTVDSQVIKLGQKFMYGPEVSAENWGEMLYIGTGDREHPSSTSYVDAIYAIPSTWLEVDPVNHTYQTLTPDNLVDVTENKIQDGTADEKIAVKAALTQKKGWYIRMPNDGEKVVSSPVLFNKAVYFTTYTPGANTVNFSDPCTTSTDRGIARLYAVDYGNGGAKFDFFKDPDNPDAITKEDRSVVIGTSIPSGVVVAITEDGVTVMVGVEGGVKTETGDDDSTVRQYFWRQVQ